MSPSLDRLKAPQRPGRPACMHTRHNFHDSNPLLPACPLDLSSQRLLTRHIILRNVCIRRTNFAEDGHGVVPGFAIQDVLIDAVEAAGADGLLDYEAGGCVFGFEEVLLEGQF